MKLTWGLRFGLKLPPSHEAGRRRKSERASLPAYKARAEILSSIWASAVTVISGDTGCGKSTQVPQLILEALLTESPSSGPTAACCNIVCTQPRRISAVSIASRVADELGQTTPGALVGYVDGLRATSVQS
jgi:HrpA-like RNA helicase